MPWFKIDEAFHGHPKVQRAGNAAVGLFVRCGSWSAQYLTDGHIPPDVVKRYGRSTEVDRLLGADLWVVNDAGFVIPDYLEYNPSADQVRAERASARERQARRRRNQQGRFEPDVTA